MQLYNDIRKYISHSFTKISVESYTKSFSNGFMFDVSSFEDKNRVFEFDYKKLEFVWCSKKWCLSQFNEKFSKSSEGLLGSMFDVRSFEAKNKVFEFDHQ